MRPMRVIDGGITAPEGFRAAGRHIGIKKVKKDMALLVSDVPAKAAGVYTQNLVKAAPVLWNRAITDSRSTVRGLVCVSGNANACTGEKGIRDNELMAKAFSWLLGTDKKEILTAATGIIGLDMPMDTVLKGIEDTFPELSNKREAAKKRRRGYYNYRYILKGTGSGTEHRRKSYKDRRYGKGQRHDTPQYGHSAFVCYNRYKHITGASSEGAVKGRKGNLQYDISGRGHKHQRYGAHYG